MARKPFSIGIFLLSFLTVFCPHYSASAPATAAPYTLDDADLQTLGVDRATLKKIDILLEEAIRERAIPGAVVLVLKDGEIILDRAYGYHTYSREMPMRSSDLFDLASVTKAFATTLASMRLVDQGKLDLDATVGTYLGELVPSHPDKAAVRVRDLLTHRSGFVPSIAFHRYLKDDDYSRTPSDSYPVQVADGFYLRGDFYRDVMWKKILDSPLRTPGKYVYSDIGMDVMKEVLERIAGQKLEVYVDEQFYRPLAARSICFRPLERFAEDRIVPTEEDTYWRKQVLKGYVQDPGAALAGGVSGHAGLFATAYDLAIVAQMLLNGGSYNGRQYLEAETVKLFSSQQSDDSRRGLGFDGQGPQPENDYPCRLASSRTFGHTGYTGTSVWIDPEQRLIYIFLSNRLYRPSHINRLLELSTRSRIQDIVYEALSTPTESPLNASIE